MVLHNQICSTLSGILALEAVDSASFGAATLAEDKAASGTATATYKAASGGAVSDGAVSEGAISEGAISDHWIESETSYGDRVHRQSLAAQQQTLRAEAEWRAGVAAVDDLIRSLQRQTGDNPEQSKGVDGLVMSGPLPVLSAPATAGGLSAWIFTAGAGDDRSLFQRQIQPAGFSACSHDHNLEVLPLLPQDPLSAERFCLVSTRMRSLVMVLGVDDEGLARFQFSFGPATIQRVWQMLRSRVSLTRSQHLAKLDHQFEQFAPVVPDYRQVPMFTRLLQNYRTEVPDLSEPGWTKPIWAKGTHRERAAQIAHIETHGTARASGIGSMADLPGGKNRDRVHSPSARALSPDAELLQAMAHEIRTPLTTIRTLVRSLLRRKTLETGVVNRLKTIDRECTQQIDRFSLIFKAVELEAAQTTQPRSPLTAISLSQIFADSIPQWEQQASRRGLTLDVTLPPHLPMVASDPTLLTQVLTGLVERCTNGLAPNSHIHLQVMLAGHQLKLQFEPETGNLPPAGATAFTGFHRPSLKSVGQLLTFQPETGGLSLNLNATKNLFQAMGGKLTVRHHPQRGEVITVFLPLETAPIV